MPSEMFSCPTVAFSFLLQKQLLFPAFAGLLQPSPIIVTAVGSDVAKSAGSANPIVQPVSIIRHISPFVKPPSGDRAERPAGRSFLRTFSARPDCSGTR